MDGARRVVSIATLTFFASCSFDTAVSIHNAQPEATIVSHQSGDEVLEGIEVVLLGRASDTDSHAADLVVTWLVGGVEACPPTAPDSSGNTNCIVRFEEGVGDVTLQVADAQNATTVDTVTLTVIKNIPPEIQITEPAAKQRYYADQLVPLEVLVGDVETANEDLTVDWRSSIEGNLAELAADAGGVAATAVSLAEGGHLLTAEVHDTSGESSVATVVVNVGPPNSTPLCEITGPGEETTGAPGEKVTFTAVVLDADIPAEQLLAEWSSDNDGPLGSSSPTSAGDISLSTSYFRPTPTSSTSPYRMMSEPPAPMPSPTSWELLRQQKSPPPLLAMCSIWVIRCSS